MIQDLKDEPLFGVGDRVKVLRNEVSADCKSGDILEVKEVCYGTFRGGRHKTGWFVLYESEGRLCLYDDQNKQMFFEKRNCLPQEDVVLADSIFKGPKVCVCDIKLLWSFGCTCGAKGD